MYHSPAEIVEPPTSLDDETSENIILQPPRFSCVARGKPAPNITWKHNGRVVTNYSSRIAGGLSVQIRKALDGFPRYEVFSKAGGGSEDPQVLQGTGFVHIRTSVQCIQLTQEEFIWETSSELSWTQPNQTGSDEPVRNSQMRIDFEPNAEGSYVCEATNLLGTVSSSTVRLNLRYAPRRLHERLIKQALTQHVDRTDGDTRRSTELLNDPPPTSSSITTVHGEHPELSIYCIMRSNPPPTRLAWHYVPEKDRCIPTVNHAICGCPDDKLLAATDATPKSESISSPSMYRAKLVRGTEAARFVTSVVRRNPVHDVETIVVAQLLFGVDSKPELGTYAAWLTNPVGCEVCLVQLQQPSPPEDIANFQVVNITWNAVMLTWKTGFDGGLEQTVIMERLKVIQTDMKDYSLGEPPAFEKQRFLITNIPRLPASHRCWLSNLEPNTYYQFLLYAENELGRNEHVRKVNIKTTSLDFPQLERVDSYSDRLELYFAEPIPSAHFCVKIQFIHATSTKWLPLYNDCPTRDSDSTTTTSVMHTHTGDNGSDNVGRERDPVWICQTNILSNPSWYWVIQPNNTPAFGTEEEFNVLRMTRFVGQKEMKSSANLNPLKVKRFPSRAADGSNDSKPEDDLVYLPSEDIQYRIRTCLYDNTNICSPDIVYSGMEAASTSQLFSFVWVAVGLVLMLLLGLTTCGCFRMQRKRQRNVTERVWVRQDNVNTGKNGDRGGGGGGVVVSRGRRIPNSQRQPIIAASLESSTEDDFKLMELSKPSCYNSPPEVCQSGSSCSLQVAPAFSTVTTPVSVSTFVHPLDMVHSISTASPVGTVVTSCSLVLNSAAAVGPGTQVLSSIFSVATPSDLIRDVEGIGVQKPHNTTSPVLLIPATQLSTVEFTAKTVDDDPVSLILHIPVQSNTSQ
ncbi:unnamed protein product [Echinostoma caproni]|uniref:Ig-like domain-containing protein n=1 Tax=Echinostoma caproni TaxID=27848 RepID=A0A183A4Z3_9TREM|nr:unnamed protein product [Echinostoma caproni]